MTSKKIKIKIFFYIGRYAMNLCILVGYCQDQGYSTDLLDPTQVESKNTFSQIQWPVPSINAESVDIFLGEE